MHGYEDWTIFSQSLNDLSRVTPSIRYNPSQRYSGSRGPDSSVTFPHQRDEKWRVFLRLEFIKELAITSGSSRNKVRAARKHSQYK